MIYLMYSCAIHEGRSNTSSGALQVHASLGEWAEAAEAYRQSAEGERSVAQAARAWFGAGVAVAKQQVLPPLIQCD